jgi:hypothetical protein
MALTDFILKKGQIVMTTDVYSASGMFLSAPPFTYGYVEKVNDLCDSYKVGDYVIFDPTKAIKFTFDNVYYYLIEEQYALLIEPFIAPL